MHSIFRGWRRKAGIVTLVMAMAIMVDCLAERARFDEWMAHLQQIPQDQLVERSENVQGIYVEYKKMIMTPDGTDRFQSAIIQRFTYFWHLSIAIPLTLLSAYLILWKPRTRD